MTGDVEPIDPEGVKKLPPRQVIDDEYATLWYHPEGKIVHHRIKKPVSGAPFRAVLSSGLELFRRHGAHKWLSDDRLNGALHPDDSKWAMEDWSKAVVAAGWERWAIVMPEHVLGRLNMKRFINLYSEMGVAVELFGDPDEALEWLRKREPS